MGITLGKDSAIGAINAVTSRASNEAATSIQRLSSGQRLVNASGNGAELLLAASLDLTSRGSTVASRSINDTISNLSLREAALGHLDQVLSRMKELAVQSASGVLRDSQRNALDSEFQALTSEYNNTVTNASFNGQKLLTSAGASLAIQAGDAAGSSITLTFGSTSSVVGTVTSTWVGLGPGGAVPNAGAQAKGVSSDGRYVLLHSSSTNLVAGDTNGATDVFLRDTVSGTVTRVNVSTAGTQTSNTWNSDSPAMSSDARYVVFSTGAPNLVAGDVGFTEDVFIRDTQLNTTARVSVSTGGTQGNFGSFAPLVSDNGRYVYYTSNATNLVAGDTNGTTDVFVRDTVSNTTSRVSLTDAGAEANSASSLLDISTDGRYVLFSSVATNLVGGDTNGREDLFIRDTTLGTTTRVSVGTGGTESNNNSYSGKISDDGRYVTFYSAATTLAAGDTNGVEDVFWRDIQAGETRRVSVTTEGVQGSSPSDTPDISADGRYVVFQTTATELAPSGFGLLVHDTQSSQTSFIADSTFQAFFGADGSTIYATSNTDLDPGDTNGTSDAYSFTNPLFGSGSSSYVSQLSSLSISTQTDALDALTALDTNVSEVQTIRGRVASSLSRLGSAFSAATSRSEQAAAARSRITDVDSAFEVASLVRNQILVQSSTALAAQAKLSSRAVLNLLPS